MPNEMMPAKLMLLHCATLIADLIETSYLRENGEKNVKGGPVHSKLEKMNISFSILRNDSVRQALVKRFFDYQFPFDAIKRIIDELADDRSAIDCKKLRGILREYNKAILDREGMTQH
jgi:replication initiation and membrane attachment protein DnaB